MIPSIFDKKICALPQKGPKNQNEGSPLTNDLQAGKLNIAICIFAFE